MCVPGGLLERSLLSAYRYKRVTHFLGGTNSLVHAATRCFGAPSKMELGDVEAGQQYRESFVEHWGDADWHLPEVADARARLV